MIVHLVLFKFKGGVVRDDTRVAAAVEALWRLPMQIVGIRGWEHGFNVTGDAQAWDYGLRAMFDDEAALHAYLEHPAHVPVVAQWEEISELAFCDFRV